MYFRNDNIRNRYYGTFLGGYTGQQVRNSASSGSSKKPFPTGKGKTISGSTGSSKTGGGGTSTAGKFGNTSTGRTGNTGKTGGSGTGTNRSTSSSSSTNYNKATLNEKRQNTSNKSSSTIINTNYNKTTLNEKRQNTSSNYKPSSGSTPTAINRADSVNYNKTTLNEKRQKVASKNNTNKFDSSKFTSTGKINMKIEGLDYLEKANVNYLEDARKNGVIDILTRTYDLMEDKRVGNKFSKDLSTDSARSEKFKELKKKNNVKNTNNVYNFIDSASEKTPIRIINGKKYYVADTKTAGSLSVGSGILLKYNDEYFNKYGIDISNLKEGSIVPADIVDKVTKDIINDKKKYVLNVLKENNITDLTSAQIDALTSRAFSVGNISDFARNYKQYGNTEELYKNYLGTINGKGTIYEDVLTKRRDAESELFKNGYVNKNNSDRIGDDPTGLVKRTDDRIGDDPTGEVKVINSPNTSSITNKYYSDGHSLIEFNEGHTPLTSDGKSYIITEDPGSGHPLAVGKGVLLGANKQLFKEQGINVDDYKVGDTIPVEIVDRVGERIEDIKINEIKKMAEDNGISLTDYQVDALVSRSYQFGNVNGFPAAWKEANGDIEAFANNYMMQGGGSKDRRAREAELFKNGY